MQPRPAQEGGQIVELAHPQQTQTVHPRGLALMQVALALSAVALVGRLDTALALAPLLGSVVGYALARWHKLHFTVVLGGAIVVNLTLLSADSLYDYASEEAFGLLPLAGYICAYLFNHQIFKPTPNRLAVMGGCVAVLLLVQLTISQSLARSVWVLSLFFLIWLALCARRSPAVGTANNTGIKGLGGFRYALTTSFSTLAMSLPLMLAFFLLFPRLPMNLLQSEQAQKSTASTGLSQTLKLGSIAELKKSNEPAFIATFRSEPPQGSSLYWRAVVLDQLHGNEWSSSENELAKAQQSEASKSVMEQANAFKANKPANGISYLSAWAASNTNTIPVVLEGTSGVVIAALSTQSLLMTARSDGTYGLPWTLQTSTSPRVRLHSLAGFLDPGYTLDSALEKDKTDLTRWTTLPQNFNPKTQAVGRRLKAQHTSDEKVIAAFLSIIELEPYHYTLKPAKLTSQAIDDFFLNTRAGFCEHYASAFVVAMRGAGIPARLVTGYLTAGPVERSVKVGQGDAHAWAEVWLSGRGWVRQDPTASIDPARVDPDAANARLESTPKGVLGFFELSWSQYSFRAERAWREGMLGFDADQQRKIFRSLGIENASKPLLLISSLLVVVTLSFLWRYFGGMRHALLPHRTGNDMSRKLARKCRSAGLSRPPGQTWRHFAHASAPRLTPGDARELLELVALYEKAIYSGNTDVKSQREFNDRVRVFGPKKQATLVQPGSPEFLRGNTIGLPENSAHQAKLRLLKMFHDD